MRRKDATPVVWRKVVEEKTNKTIFGETIVTVKRCNTCKELQPIVNFYIESLPKRKQKDQTRPQCCTCWDVAKGRTRPRTSNDFVSIESFT